MYAFSSRFVATGFISIGLLVGFLVSASTASADTATSSCSAIPSIEGFRPYVYEDGDLHSFDYTVTGDGQMTVVTTIVDGRSLENRYNTTWDTDATNTKKIHVDVPNWYGFSKDVRVTVDVMMSQTSTTGCISQKEFVVNLPASKPAKFAQTTPDHAPSKHTKTPSASPNVKVTPSTGADASGNDADEGGTIDTDHRGGGFFKSLFGAILGNKAFSSACKSWPFATWIFLVIICIVSIVVIIDSLPYLLAGNGVRFAIALLAVFLVLLALWFTFDRCREHRWFPIVVTLLTLGTLIMPTTLEGRKGKTKKFDF